MPFYRGVEKDDLIESVEKAVAFLRKLNLGPISSRTLNVISRNVAELELAETNSELVYMVNEHNLGLAMAMFGKVIKYHALTDPSPGGKPSEAMEIYKSLSVWGAFPPKQFRITSIMDKEINDHLLPLYANALTDEDEEPGSRAQKSLADFLQGVGEQEKAETGKETAATWLKSSVPLVVGFIKAGVGNAEVNEILQGNPTGARIIPAALEAMLDVDQRIEDLKIKSPIATYRVNLGQVPDDEDERDAVYDPFVDELKSLLQPFYARDEMLPNILVVTDPKSGEGNIILFLTKDAAQYVADHIPDDTRLLDAEGNRIPPSPPRRGGPAPRHDF